MVTIALIQIHSSPFCLRPVWLEEDGTHEQNKQY